MKVIKRSALKPVDLQGTFQFFHTFFFFSPYYSHDIIHLNFILIVLKNEIAIMHTLSHPHIVGLKEVYDTSTNVYLVMELMKGAHIYSSLLTCYVIDSLLTHRW